MKNFLKNLEENIMAVLLPGTCLLVVLSVFGRYTEFYNMYWAEEMIRYLYIFVAYLGISLGVKSGAHFRVQLVVNMFPRSIKIVIQILNHLIVVVFLALVVYHSGLLVKRLFIMKQTSPVLKIPMFIPYIAVPLGCFTMCVRVAARLIHDIRYPHEAQEQES